MKENQSIEFLRQAALAGRERWLKLKEQYKVDDSCYLIICPTDDYWLNKTAMDHLADFLARKYISKALVVTSCFSLNESFSCHNGFDIRFAYLGQEQMDEILKYYRLTQFAPNIVVVSLNEPFGNGNIIGKKGITMADYIRDALYV